MMSKDLILNFLDDAYNGVEMPWFDNMNIDYITSRLSIYRSDEKWIVLFESIVWWCAASGLETLIEIVGTGVDGKQGFDDDRVLYPGKLDEDYEEEKIISFSIRGEKIDTTDLVVTTDYDVQPEYGFWVSVALAEKYKDRLFASEEEIKKFIPSEFKHLLTIYEWDHPTFKLIPSQTESFPIIAEVIQTGDSSLWCSVDKPNTHWSNWQPK